MSSQLGSGSEAAVDVRRAEDSRLAGEIKRLLADGDRDRARERFGLLIDRHQRRAARIAFCYLKDAADVDEVVQDAFMRAYTHLSTFREDLFFELWFTRIVINGCLDRLKARRRRARWLRPAGVAEDGTSLALNLPSGGPSPEAVLMTKEDRAQLLKAIDRLPERQRSVVILTQVEGHTAHEVAEMLGLKDATVRVHLFRAVRTLRRQLVAARLAPTVAAPKAVAAGASP